MVKHKPIGIEPFLRAPLALLEAMQQDLQTTAPYLVPPLVQVTEGIKETILRDERGPPVAPEWTDEAMNWQAAAEAGRGRL